ncbi:PleD family two-component system response regulator [Deltaproteobacteria bacterium]|nr:PleD family two-component system response regulator [Deltaproteobacteria bacterium]
MRHPAANTSQTRRNREPGRTSGVKSRPSILVVDDDPVIGCVLAGALNRGGFEVNIFKNGVKALESFDNLKADLAVVDWVMPDIDGLSLIDRLKAKSPNMPAMLITSYGEHDLVRQALQLGRVDMVLDKPFDLANFLSIVSSFVNKAEAAAPPAEKAKPQTLAGWLALAGRGAYFEQILDSLIDAVVMIDRQGRIIYHNKGAERMFGFRGRADGHLPLMDFCPADNRLTDLFNHFFGPHPPVQEQSEGYFLKLDGTKFYTIFSASLFQAGDHGSAVLLVVKDINDRHLLDEKATAKAHALELLALTDPLTGLYNRRCFDRRLEDECRRLERYNSPLTLVMIDLDHFKNVNDNFGHLVGDQVLKRVAELLTQTLRDVDTVSRWGGEEYMLLLPETGRDTGISVARRLHRIIGEADQWENITPGLRVTVSMGLVNISWEGRKMNSCEILEKLDRALYRAKESGRDRVVRYDSARDAFEEV